MQDILQRCEDAINSLVQKKKKKAEDFKKMNLSVRYVHDMLFLWTSPLVELLMVVSRLLVLSVHHLCSLSYYVYLSSFLNFVLWLCLISSRMNSECCSFRGPGSSKDSDMPCLMFSSYNATDPDLERTLDVLCNTIYPVLLETVIKGTWRMLSL